MGGLRPRYRATFGHTPGARASGDYSTHSLHVSQRTNGSAIAKAIDYVLNRCEPLTHYLKDGRLPIDNNWLENRIRPIALGRRNWLFAGSLRAGQRAAALMSLIQSAKLDGHDPYVYLKDVLDRLPTQPRSRLEELLPHRWHPGSNVA